MLLRLYKFDSQSGIELLEEAEKTGGTSEQHLRSLETNLITGQPNQVENGYTQNQN